MHLYRKQMIRTSVESKIYVPLSRAKDTYLYRNQKICTSIESKRYASLLKATPPPLLILLLIITVQCISINNNLDVLHCYLLLFLATAALLI